MEETPLEELKAENIDIQNSIPEQTPELDSQDKSGESDKSMDDAIEQNSDAVAAAMETELSNEPASDEVISGANTVGEIDPEKLKNILEALLFASDEPLTAQTIKEILKLSTDTRKLRQDILDINKRLQAERRPFEIAEVAGGFQLRTITSYQKYLKGLFKDRAMRRLSGQALETLAIIAYKQPVSKAEIEGIRNVATDSAMKTLLEKRLIKILGKSEEKPGKPIVYGTTRDFLKYFGLNRISDLPKIEEFEDIAKSQEHEKTELIHDFKRDPEKTKTLAPQEIKNVEAPAEDAPPEIVPDMGPVPDEGLPEDVISEDSAEESAEEESPPSP